MFSFERLKNLVIVWLSNFDPPARYAENYKYCKIRQRSPHIFISSSSGDGCNLNYNELETDDSFLQTMHADWKDVILVQHNSMVIAQFILALNTEALK